MNRKQFFQFGRNSKKTAFVKAEAAKQQRNERLVKIMVAGMRVVAYQNGETNVSYEDARAANEFLLLEEANKIILAYQKKEGI